jgi:hypothetical protein
VHLWLGERLRAWHEYVSKVAEVQYLRQAF